jgi:Holliday junction DNA helicase RuvA
MFEYIKGKVTQIKEEKIIVETCGLGFEIFPTKELLNKVIEGSEFIVYVYSCFADSNVKIYGFVNELEKKVFIDLIGVPDIGPAKAIKILSKLNCESIIDCVLNEKIELLSQIPGIGFKTAKKLTTFLKDKFTKYKDLEVVTSYTDIYIDLKKALRQLGYKDGEINFAIEKMSKKKFEGGLDEAIKQCLEILTKQ